MIKNGNGRFGCDTRRNLHHKESCTVSRLPSKAVQSPSLEFFFEKEGRLKTS